jgi:hypothetical protein
MGRRYPGQANTRKRGLRALSAVLGIENLFAEHVAGWLAS